MTNITQASVLAFERKLDISDAYFWQTSSQDKAAKPIPVVVREKSVRGTISNRLKNKIAEDPAKLDAEIQKANLQTIDAAFLQDNKDTLQASWSCKVLPFKGEPCTCNSPSYQERLLQIVEGYLQNQGLAELAHRYALNIANARWLWRNRMSAASIEVAVSCTVNGELVSIVFDNAKDFQLNDDFSAASDQIRQLAKLIESGLRGEQFIILQITAEAIMGFGQEVFPSQELVLDTGREKSKVLYRLNENQQAGMHSQKLGNAVRTIDTWYSDDAQFPIAIEPYGAVTTLGTAFRQPKQKHDFYSLFDNWILKDKEPSPEQQHYIMAVLIRGGVFGASLKE